MKCENCGYNDATVYYRQSVNGRTIEKHLCADCAQRLGCGTMGGIRDLFRTLPQLMAEDELFGFPAFTPAAQRTLRAVPAETTEELPLLDEETARSLRHERERKALRVQLDEAVEAEDFERAAKLRDELKELGD